MINSVKAYGAKGDGITDDTEAFRLALMQEGEVHLPDGMYVISGALPVSRLCRGISSNRGGGIILAKHPEWGYNFARYFHSAIIVPTTVSYRLKCAAVRWAIKLFAKVGRIPGWLDRWRASLSPVTDFRIANLCIRGNLPTDYRDGPGVGGLSFASLDPHLRFTVVGNHFQSDEYLAGLESKNHLQSDVFEAKAETTKINTLPTVAGPTNMVLVPAEPTDEMLAAMTDACGDIIFESGSEYYFRDDADALWFGRQVWAAMVRQGQRG